jgi:hypothetical protein
MIAEVGGMVRPSGLLEAELRAPERRAELGDQLLGAVGGHRTGRTGSGRVVSAPQ